MANKKDICIWLIVMQKMLDAIFLSEKRFHEKFAGKTLYKKTSIHF